MNDDERLDDLQFAGLKILQKTAGFRFEMCIRDRRSAAGV